MSQVGRRGPKRPIMKEITNVFQTAIGNSTVHSDMHTSDESETLVRSIIKIALVKGGASGIARCTVCLVVERDGSTLSGINDSDVQSTYKPVQDVLWIGVAIFGANSVEPVFLEADVKGMRKLQNGDKITLVYLSSVTDGFDIYGHVMTFYKQ